MTRPEFPSRWNQAVPFTEASTRVREAFDATMRSDWHTVARYCASTGNAPVILSDADRSMLLACGITPS